MNLPNKAVFYYYFFSFTGKTTLALVKTRPNSSDLWLKLNLNSDTFTLFKSCDQKWHPKCLKCSQFECHPSSGSNFKWTLIHSRGGLEVETWTDNSLHSASVGSNPAWVWYIDRSEVETLLSQFKLKGAGGSKKN